MTTHYPIKVNSRAVTRAKKLRLSWFVVGTSFGVGCAWAMLPGLHDTAANIAQISPPAIIHTAENTAPVQPQPVITQAQAQQPQQMAQNNIQYPLTMNLKVGSGDTLTTILTDAGVTSDEAYNAVQSIRNVFDPRKLDVGQNMTISLDRADDGTPVITSMNLPVSLVSSLEITRNESDNFDVRKIDAPLERKLARAGGEINGSIYETAQEQGVPASLIGELINAYSYDVDFQRDIKEGDSMQVLYEKMQTKDGVTAGHGNMIYAELDLGDREMRVYRYVDASGHADYYNEKGESVRKALLRTPINGAKVTSGYGMRMHPILGYSKMHRGIDFGAALGTPIYAAGDGTVEFEGVKGGYGNYLKIKHNNTYASAYGHISRFASGIHPGSKVKQGQIVAYVGMTGMATGPHLHYEILVNDEQVNPSGVKFKTGNVLAGRELASFRKTMESVQAQLTTMQHNKLAMADIDQTHIDN